VPSCQSRCSKTASLRASATFAFLVPIRLANLMAQALRDDQRSTPGQQNVRGFEQVAAGDPVAAFGDPAAHVALPRLVAPRCQTEVSTDA
jgi:hypothetical protein